MRYRVKIVPKSEPNADGEWVMVGIPAGMHNRLPAMRFREAAAYLENFVDPACFVCAYERVIECST